MSLERLTITSSSGDPRIVLETDNTTGMPSMRFLDQAAKDRLVIGLDPSGNPQINLLRKDGSIAMRISVSEGPDAAMAICYPNGHPAFRIQLPASGTVELALFHVDGECVWAAP